MLKLRNTGFTLIEVLIVLAIIVVMVIILIIAINPGDKLAKTRDVGRKSSIAQIARALDRYYINYGEYPYPCEESGSTCASATGWGAADALVSSGELTKMPDDPINDAFTSVDQESGYSFYIITGTSGSYYIVGAFLEGENDGEAIANLPFWPLEMDCSTGLWHADNAYVKTSYNCPEGATPAPTAAGTPTPTPTAPPLPPTATPTVPPATPTATPTVPPATPTPTPAVSDGLISHWSFDEGTGLVAGDGVGGKNGSLVNMDNSNWVAGVQGTGLSFDGVDEYVQTLSSDLKNLDEFTIMAWIKNDNLIRHHIIWQGNSLGNGGGAEHELGLTVSNTTDGSLDRIQFFVESGGGADLNISSPFSDTGIWHHVAAVVTGFNTSSPNATLYIGGSQTGTDTASTINKAGWDTNLRIGSPGVASRLFDGVIDEVKVFDKALNQTEVQSEM